MTGTTRSESLQFNVSAFWAIAFTALLFVHNEVHEISHTGVGRLICGAWGPRNFNSWQLACRETPEIVLAPIAGLVFSYGLMWIGYYVIKALDSPSKKSVGLCLIFAAMPFGRIYTVAQSGGDEMVILRGVFPEMNSLLRLAIGLSIVLVFIIPPLHQAFVTLPHQRQLMAFVGFLLVPYVLFEIIVLRVANPLLEQGVLASTGVLGSPVFVNVWTGFWVLMLILSWQHLPTILISHDGA
ncbi:hypothetical protein ABNG03_04955 [Halorubrum sp. RMP-47]|uniref:Uncharacterized protein n=1 Tax=Halorubrum miltondacostae TaxID=3076378 RepID=A0ABD5M4I0_9EURY